MLTHQPWIAPFDRSAIFDSSKFPRHVTTIHSTRTDLDHERHDVPVLSLERSKISPHVHPGIVQGSRESDRERGLLFYLHPKETPESVAREPVPGH